jgi:hypothetical protein
LLVEGILLEPEKETAMSTDKKTETPKQPPKTPADELAKTKKKGDVELTEEELKRTTGGAFDAFIKIKS